jgi:hypothetical protein
VAEQSIVGGAIGRGAGSCSCGVSDCRGAVTDYGLLEQIAASQSGQLML